ncbi:MAG: FkbM family methyltransferase [Candidatus Kapabacteria bacterium]|nr:FkbM family methyltransferase [Candidatus Kapabacteria bacterium]
MGIKRFLSPAARDFLHDARAAFNKLTGIDFTPYGLYHVSRRRQIILDQLGIDCTIDAGANRGQYGGLLRRHGYKGIIHSYEPISSAYKELQKKIQSDPNWFAYHCALGEKKETAVVHVSNNSQSSSLLDMTSAHHDADSTSMFISDETINVVPLDDEFANITSGAKRIFLKLDVQGMEMSVMRGAENSLKHIPLVQAELSFVELYKGESLFLDFVLYMQERGFRIILLEQGFSDHRTGYALQCDLMFLNENNRL